MKEFNERMDEIATNIGALSCNLKDNGVSFEDVDILMNDTFRFITERAEEITDKGKLVESGILMTTVMMMLHQLMTWEKEYIESSAREKGVSQDAIITEMRDAAESMVRNHYAKELEE